MTAALQIVDRDGLDGLTMRALGRELRVDPMAAYYHVPNKAAIFDGVAEAVWSQLEIPDSTGQPWQIELEQIARAVRETLRRHPHALPIIATRPIRSAPAFALVDRTLGLLLGAGMPAQEAIEFGNAAIAFVVGHVLAETGPSMAHAHPVEDDLLAAVQRAGPDRFRHLDRALAAIDPHQVTKDRIFDAGVYTLLRGLERRLEEIQRHGGGP